MEHFFFTSTQTHNQLINGKRKTSTEAVSIKNGKGMKSVVKSVNGKITRAKRKLTRNEVKNIMNKKFMPNLFTPCHKDCTKKLNLRSTRKAAKKLSK